MASRTQIVCLCEGLKGQSIDEVFINKLMKCLNPNWLRRSGSNTIRLMPCGNRDDVVERMPAELRNCLAAGAETTLMVWADLDDDHETGDTLKAEFWGRHSGRESAKRNSTGLCSFSLRTGWKTGLSFWKRVKPMNPKKGRESNTIEPWLTRQSVWRIFASRENLLRGCRHRFNGRAEIGGC